MCEIHLETADWPGPVAINCQQTEHASYSLVTGMERHGGEGMPMTLLPSYDWWLGPQIWAWSRFTAPHPQPPQFELGPTPSPLLDFRKEVTFPSHTCIPNSLHMHVVGLWEETRVPGRHERTLGPQTERTLAVHAWNQTQDLLAETRFYHSIGVFNQGAVIFKRL